MNADTQNGVAPAPGAVAAVEADAALGPEDAYVELAVEVFSMLADATRVRIILALRDTELPVGRIAELVDKSPTAVSQHLAKLRMARIVVTRQEAQRVYYRLADEHARRLVTDAIHQAQHAVDAETPHHQRS